jgi:hypothetical protein
LTIFPQDDYDILMVDKVNPSAQPDPSKQSEAYQRIEKGLSETKHSVKVPESFQKAGFTEDDYKKYFNLMIKSVSDDMNKITNEAIKRLKEERQKIESDQ